MGFVRGWWPSVVVGLVVALLGIGVAGVAGMPAGSAPEPARALAGPVSRPTSVAPAAIELEDDIPAPVSTQIRPSPSLSPSPTPKPKLKPKPKPKPKASQRPRPKESPQPTPVRRVAPVPVVTPRPKPSPVPAPSSSTPAPLAPLRPAQALDLQRWKLTLPAGRPGHPVEYRQPVLGSLASGSYVRLTPDRGVAFRAPVGGATTENSSYPRSELREMSAGGRREAGWTNASGRHVMTISQAITATPRAKPHVVAGQIHGAEDDVVMIRLEGRRLFVESDGNDVGLLDPRYRLGTKFTVAIIATPRGVGVVYNGHRTVRVAAVGRGWYFKAGCYPQSNPDRGDRPTAYGEVVIYALTVRHSAP